MSNVEIWLEANGDFIQTDNGDLKLATDTPYSSDATTQRLTRLLMTNPRLIDAAGNPISTPGDLFYPNYGAGEPALVDQPVTPAFVQALQSRIINALLKDPTVSPNPRPTVTVNQLNSSTVQVAIAVTTVTGQQVTFVLPTV